MIKYLLTAFTVIAIPFCPFGQIMNIHTTNGETIKYNLSEIDSITFGSEAGTLKWLGHASIKIKTNDAVVIYIDPYAGTDYSEPADIILVSHGHSDHNQIGKVTKKADCSIYSGQSADVGGSKMSAGDSVDVKGIKIKAVEAYNSNHPQGSGVGFVVEIHGIKVYHAGDTGKIDEMAQLTAMHIDYALLCIDGIYNMSAAAAMEAVTLIKPKKAIPIHVAPPNATEQQKQENINQFTPPNKLIMAEGDTIYL
jgi:L-ascorbate metabolism protein UlaG (beta-lactamase superfamily)